MLILKFGLKGPRIFSEARQASCTTSLTISGIGTPPTRAAAAMVPAQAQLSSLLYLTRFMLKTVDFQFCLDVLLIWGVIH